MRQELLRNTVRLIAEQPALMKRVMTMDNNPFVSEPPYPFVLDFPLFGLDYCVERECLWPSLYHDTKGKFAITLTRELASKISFALKSDYVAFKLRYIDYQTDV